MDRRAFPHPRCHAPSGQAQAAATLFCAEGVRSWERCTTRFRIILTNAVKYVTNVERYDRRIQSAINIQGKKMQRRAAFLLTRALRQAGWK